MTVFLQRACLNKHRIPNWRPKVEPDTYDSKTLTIFGLQPTAISVFLMVEGLIEGLLWCCAFSAVLKYQSPFSWCIIALKSELSNIYLIWINANYNCVNTIGGSWMDKERFREFVNVVILFRCISVDHRYCHHYSPKFLLLLRRASWLLVWYLIVIVTMLMKRAHRGWVIELGKGGRWEAGFSANKQSENALLENIFGNIISNISQFLYPLNN